MSKKSRKRNKKILAALALAGGAALMARRGKGTSAVTGVVNPNAPKTEWISRKDTVPETKVAPIIGSGGGGIHQGKTKPFQSKWHGVAPAPPGILNPYNPYQNIKGRLNRAKGGSAKKAKVTGIAKRGFGRALMKGKK